MSRFINLIGQRFGRLVVIEEAGRDKRGRAKWKCLCDCGNEIIVRAGDLRTSNTQSCGCLNKELVAGRRTIHGHKKEGKTTSTYRSWQGMMQRCYNPNSPEYHNYGGRGIEVCERWHKFENFLADMGECPERLTIERIENNGDYCLKNCKWDTQKNQQRNKRDSIVLTLNGESRHIAEWAEIRNWKIHTLYTRYQRGWPDKKILTADPKIYHGKEHNGKS